MALSYDALFLRRHGFDPTDEPLKSDVAADIGIVVASLEDSGGGHIVAHEQGAISAMLAAVDRPELVYSLTLVEPACLSLTAELPATAYHRSLMEPLFAVRDRLNDADYQREYFRRAFSAEASGLDTPEARRSARRLRLQAPPWEAPLHIVPGVPTLVLTGGWEPLYEEIAGYLQETGALRRVAAGGHRPQDSVDGDRIIRSFVADVVRTRSVKVS
jgi:pimeloyl-ACP methyl ester carboxylesterase